LIGRIKKMHLFVKLFVLAALFFVGQCAEEKNNERELISGFLRKVEQKAKGVESKVTNWVKDRFGGKRAAAQSCPIAAAAAARKDLPMRKSVSDWTKKHDEYKNARDRWHKNPSDQKAKDAHNKARDALDKASEAHHKAAKEWEGSTHEWCAASNYCAIGPAVPAPAPIPSTTATTPNTADD
jgi:hypothetical protein